MAYNNFFLTLIIIVIETVQVVVLFINQNITDVSTAILTDRQSDS